MQLLAFKMGLFLERGKWNENKLKVNKIQGTKLIATYRHSQFDKRLNYQVKPVRWQTHRKYSDISPYDVWKASLTRQSDFLGLFTSYITPEASNNYYARTGHSTVCALCFSENRLFTRF